MGTRSTGNIVDRFYEATYELMSGEHLTLRRPVVSDAEALIRQMQQADRETLFLAREPEEFKFTVSEEEAFIQQVLEDENRLFLVAEVSGQVVGNCSVGRVNKGQRYRHRASFGIAILEQFWGQGIGKKMMQACIQWCILHEIEQLELEVVSTNERAIGLYRSFGFEIYGTKEKSLKYRDDTYADEYFMILFFTETQSIS